MLSILPVCSPAVTMRTIMVGDTGCFAKAAGNALAALNIPLRRSCRLFQTTLPTVWEDDLQYLQIGTPLRTSEPGARERARANLWRWAETVMLMRRESQKSPAGGGLDEIDHPYGPRARGQHNENEVML